MMNSDNGEDEHAITDVLCAFIREHAASNLPPKIDVQVALTALGRRPAWGKPANRNIDVTGNLTGVDLAHAHLEFAHLIDANLTSVL